MPGLWRNEAMLVATQSEVVQSVDKGSRGKTEPGNVIKTDPTDQRVPTEVLGGPRVGMRGPMKMDGLWRNC